MGHSGRLRARILGAIGVGALLVAVGVALLVRNTISLRNQSDATVRADDYLARVVNVERLVVDAETGLRGYVITGRVVFLQPLSAAQAQLPAAEQSLARAARSNHAFQPQVTGLIEATKSYMSGYVRRLLSTAAHDLPAVRTFAVTLEGKHDIDSIRARTAVLERLVSGSQAARQRAARQQADESIVDGVVVLVLLTLLTLAVGGYLGHLAVTRERERARAQETAETLQRSILPPDPPEIPGCELAIRFLPTGGGIVGGDFYDAFEISPGCYAIIIGDVVGKGAAAAAVSAMARWTLRNLTGATIEPADVLRFLNDALLRHNIERRFLTLAYLLVSLEHDHAHVAVACAGHPPPVLVPLEGDVAPVTARGDLLGAWPDIELSTAEIDLHPGECLVAFTDGVSDPGPGPRRSPEHALHGRPAGASAAELADMLQEFARPLQGAQRDDIAILALRFQHPVASPTGGCGPHRDAVGTRG